MRAELEFGLLGGFQARRGARTVPLPAKPRVVLAALLLAQGTPVTVDALVEALWGDRPPGAARSTLQVHVLRLRRALDEPQLIETRPGAYLVPAEVAGCDVTEFRGLLRRARDGGDPEREHAALAGALALWRGRALLDVESDFLHRTEGARLEQQRLDAAERRAELALALDKPDEVVADMTVLVREHPLREHAWAHLLEALRRTGRRAEALSAYHRVRTLFRDELGVEPHPRVRAVHQAVLAGEPVPPRPAHLPSDVRVFVGRQQERVRLRDAVVSAPLVVLSGAPGVGKSVLAVHVAHRMRAHYPDGQLHADLRGFSSAEPLPAYLVLERFLRALGLAPHQVPADESERIAWYRSLLAGRRVLVLLDNVAHADQVRPFVPGAADCGLIVTSREDLPGLAVTDGAAHVRLDPLSGPEAHDLLVAVLGARAEAEPDAVRDLAEVCGGLPLALRIAGANLTANPHLAVSDYRDVLRVAPTARLRVGDGEIAVSAAFDLSFDRLPASARSLYRALGVAPGADFTRAVAAALVPRGDDALDRLTAANLVAPSGRGRYHLHTLIRGHAALRAGEAPEETTRAVHRVLDFYLHSADRATRLLHAGHRRLELSPPVDGVPPRDHRGPDDARAWLTAELPNLVAAACSAHRHGRVGYARQVADVLRGVRDPRIEGFATWARYALWRWP